VPGLEGGVGPQDLVMDVVKRLARNVDERAVIDDLAFPGDRDDVGVRRTSVGTECLVTGEGVNERA